MDNRFSIEPLSQALSFLLTYRDNQIEREPEKVANYAQILASYSELFKQFRDRSDDTPAGLKRFFAKCASSSGEVTRLRFYLDEIRKYSPSEVAAIERPDARQQDWIDNILKQLKRKRRQQQYDESPTRSAFEMKVQERVEEIIKDTTKPIDEATKKFKERVDGQRVASKEQLNEALGNVGAIKKNETAEEKAAREYEEFYRLDKGSLLGEEHSLGPSLQPTGEKAPVSLEEALRRKNLELLKESQRKLAERYNQNPDLQNIELQDRAKGYNRATGSITGATEQEWSRALNNLKYRLVPQSTDVGKSPYNPLKNPLKATSFNLYRLRESTRIRMMNFYRLKVAQQLVPYTLPLGSKLRSIENTLRYPDSLSSAMKTAASEGQIFASRWINRGIDATGETISNTGSQLLRAGQSSISPGGGLYNAAARAARGGGMLARGAGGAARGGLLGARLAGATGGAAARGLLSLLLANPMVLAIVIFIGGVFLMFIFNTLFNSTALLDTPGFSESGGVIAGENKVNVSKSGPSSAKVDEELRYEIKIGFLGGGEADIEVEDILPQKTEYVSSSDQGVVNNGRVRWEIKGLKNGTTKSINLVLRSVEDKVWINNYAQARILKVIGGSGVVGGSCPKAEDIAANRQTTPEGCKYFNPGVGLFVDQGGDLTTTQINSYIEKYHSLSNVDKEEFTRRVGYIVDKSRAAGVNPAILLAYWKSESRFSSYPGASDLGCAPGVDGLRGFEKQVDCALGNIPNGSRSMLCARSKDAESPACKELRGIRESTTPKSYASGTISNAEIYKDYPITYPIQSFDDFAESYGSKSPKLSIAEGVVNRNCTHTYNELMEVFSTLNACTGGATNTSINVNNNSDPVTISGTATSCEGEVVNFGVEKRLLPLPAEGLCSTTITKSCGRPGDCAVPRKIVIHTTASPMSLDDVYKYFAGGSGGRGGRGVGAHFMVGKDGKAIQMVESLKEKVEVAYAVAGYSDHVSLELTHNGVYTGREDIPQAQYQATLKIIKGLMDRYGIPVGNLEYTWKANNGTSNAKTDQAMPGLYGHYQLNPIDRQDPGINLTRDIREDIKKVANTPPQPHTPSRTVMEREISIGNTKNKRIAITFDYGQGEYGRGVKLSSLDYAYMYQILDILKKHSVKSTLFVTGAFLEDSDNAKVLQRIKEEGHELANHSYDHNDMAKLTESEFISQLKRTEEAAQRVIGRNTKPYFRYPFLSDKKHTAALAREGYYYIKLTCDGGDWKEDRSTGRVLNSLISSECIKNGSIVVLHGYTKEAAEALDRALIKYKADGYEVTTLTRVLEGIL